MSKFKGRPVELLDGSGSTGVFQCWGTSYIRVNGDKYLSITVAVVELTNGIVVKVEPNTIQFKDIEE